MNKIQLIGRVGRSVEVRNTDSTPFATLSLATSEKYIKDGEKKEITDWHNLVVFGKLVAVVEKYATKGKLIYVEGKMRYRKYKGRDNVERTAAEVVVTGIELLSTGEAQVEQVNMPIEWRVNLKPLPEDF